MQRRQFLRDVGIGTGALLAGRIMAAGRKTPFADVTDSPATNRYAKWLEARHKTVMRPESVEAFLQPTPNNQWARFDPELGYVPSDSIQRDGMDGARSVYRYGPHGERKTISYAERPCRINTYGDSFTHGHQVSDGETWQEHLAAHLGEPIRNFGVGGYGVWQAFARLRRMERTDCKAPYLIFNIYDDDHLRSIMPWRGFFTNWNGSAEMYHGTPWTHLRVNLDSGAWEEVPGPCATPQALRDLHSLGRTLALVADHEVIQLRAMMDGVADVPRDRIVRLADWAKLNLDFSDASARRESATRLLTAMARASTKHVMEKLLAFAGEQKRKLMVLFSYGSRAVLRVCEGEPIDPDDVTLAAWLRERGVPTVNVLDAHREDFAQFRIEPAAYIKRLFNGHYTPRGNQFFAFAAKNAVVEWLDPKPVAYQPGGTIIDFQDGRYLDKAP